MTELTAFERDEIAEDPDTTSEELLRIAPEADDWTLEIIARHPHIDALAAEHVIEDGSEYALVLLAVNPNTPVETLGELAVHPRGDSHLRFHLAAAAHLDVGTITLLSEDEDEFVRRGIAASPYTPVTVLARLAADTESSVRKAVAENKHTPVQVLRELLVSDDVDIQAAVITNGSLGLDPYAILGTARRAEISAYWLAGNPDASQDILEALCHHDNPDVREAAAHNPNTPPDGLRYLFEEHGMGECVAQHASTPGDIMLHLAKEGNEDIRHEIALNPFSPEEAFFLLSGQGQKYWRDLAVNPATPAVLLDQLVEKGDVIVRLACLGNGGVTGTLLSELAGDEDQRVRAGVALNPRTPGSVVRGLINDRASRVSGTARAAVNSWDEELGGESAV